MPIVISLLSLVLYVARIIRGENGGKIKFLAIPVAVISVALAILFIYSGIANAQAISFDMSGEGVLAFFLNVIDWFIIGGGLALQAVGLAFA